MKVPDGISIPNPKANRNMYCVKLQKSLYGLKQSGRMWYNQLSEFLKLKGYTNNDDYPCVFIKKSSTGFYIISMYVDDLNIIGNEPDINEARRHLKTEFEMKDLGKPNSAWVYNLSIYVLIYLYTKLPMSRKFWSTTVSC